MIYLYQQIKTTEREISMKIKVNGIVIGEVATNRSLTIAEAMYALGYDISDPDDLKEGYERGIEGFYIDDNLDYAFDIDAVKVEA